MQDRQGLANIETGKEKSKIKHVERYGGQKSCRDKALARLIASYLRELIDMWIMIPRAILFVEGNFVT